MTMGRREGDKRKGRKKTIRKGKVRELRWDESRRGNKQRKDGRVDRDRETKKKGEQRGKRER